jgi:membrane fusion protein (multidrug efflux system)
MKRYLAAGLLGLALAGCGGEGQAARNNPQEGGGGPAGEAAVPVKTETAQRGPIAAYIQTHARLEAERWVGVVSRTQGRAEQLLAEEGDQVREGQVLVRLDKKELALQAQQAQVALEQARSAHERTQALFARQLVSQEEADAARHQFESAQVALEEARLNLAYADIQAPISGTVMRRAVELGDLVRPNQEIFAVADLEPLLARIHVPEKRMHQIRQDQEARVAIDAFPGRVFASSVRMINPGVDPQSGTVKVTLEIPSQGGLLKPGMFATVRLITEEHPRALLIPKKALILETDEDDVFALVEGKARRTRVALGFADGEKVEVLSGLDEGVEVVTVGQEGLRDGTAVRVVGAGQVSAPDSQNPGRAPPADPQAQRL